jgi:hypothetical protein
VASQGRIDLHTHSTASDGLFDPATLMRAAGAAGLAAIALTDHDTTAGIAAASQALPRGLVLIPGAEISCGVRVEGRWISTHVLAYLFDPAEPEFAALRARLRDGRATRARRMVEKLAADGHPVRWEQVEELAAGSVGRPHVAAALVEAGLVASINDAFTRDWIGTGGRYAVGKDEPEILEALRLIHGAGGVSVFAHPFAAARGATVGPDVIATMARAGLTGIEIDHPDHTPAARTRLRALAAELGLVGTGASDFHGGSKAQRLGDESTDRAALATILERATGDEPRIG